MTNYNLGVYRKWLSENVRLTNAFAPEALRELTFHLLMGRNYRLLTEASTKEKLLTTYVWLSDVVNSAKQEYGTGWKEAFLKELVDNKKKSPEQRNLIYWLLGTTSKGAVNLGISNEDFPDILAEMATYCTNLFTNLGRPEEIDNAWLFMMAGSATLNIRGSQKSKIGKILEKVFLKTLLTMLGFEQNVNFWMNVQRDNEVGRETDAEIATKRGRLRIEVGLIAQGNQEVIEDKIGRVGKGGIILFDKIGNKSNIPQSAVSAGVKLIQIRGNQPLIETYRYILPLVDFALINPPVLEEDLKRIINELPENIFQ
jgi:hypothetical protein